MSPIVFINKQKSKDDTVLCIKLAILLSQNVYIRVELIVDLWLTRHGRVALKFRRENLLC